MKYRSEIDGLRALSVLSVIFFHADFGAFAGGYVGVDVFFVISGYLITAIIHRELREGAFSVKRFYERRARRILPALFFIMMVSGLFAWKWMLPKQLEDFCKSVLSVLLFSSNIFFWQQSGYFSPSNSEKPLIHTWSLSLEEQFYFFFPLLLLFSLRLSKKKLIAFIGTLYLLSLSLAHWGSVAKPAATFFLLPTRIWELLMGSLLALVSFRVPESVEKWLAGLGLGLIGWGVFTFDAQTQNPSLYTLIPTIGTCLVLFAAKPTNLVGRILGTPVLVSTGLLSYSAYLWHQPVFAFARIRSITPLEQKHYFVLIGLVFLLAAFSWKFIEVPFRKSQWKFSGKAFPIIASCSLFLLVFSGGGIVKRGFPSRFSQRVLQLAAASVHIPPQCPDMSDGDSQSKMGNLCTIGNKSKKPTLAILGDSHAGALIDAFGEVLLKEGNSAVSIWAWACPPLLDFEVPPKLRNNKCRQLMNQGLQKILNDEGIKNVVLVGFWTRYLEPGDSSVADNQAFQVALKRTTQALVEKNKRIIFVKTVPEYQLNIAETLAKKALNKESLDLAKEYQTDREIYFVKNKSLQEVLKAIEMSSPVKVVETADVFCKQSSCKYRDESGNAFYQDSNHLSRRGAKEIVPVILEQLNS